MTIVTNFNVGDKVFTIDTNSLKVKEFEVKHISATTGGGGTSVTIYDGDYSHGFAEDKCFASEKELLDFITTKDKPKTPAV